MLLGDEALDKQHRRGTRERCAEHIAILATAESCIEDRAAAETHFSTGSAPQLRVRAAAEFVAVMVRRSRLGGPDSRQFLTHEV